MTIMVIIIIIMKIVKSLQGSLNSKHKTSNHLRFLLINDIFYNDDNGYYYYYYEICWK